MTYPKSAVVAEHEDARTDGPMTGDERVVLDHWLELYRDTVLLKIAGLDAHQLAFRAVPPSTSANRANVAAPTAAESRAPTACM